MERQLYSLVEVSVELSIFFNGSTALVGLDLLLVKVSRSHSDIPDSVGLLWMSDRPIAETTT
jgi:hypothetical protein